MTSSFGELIFFLLTPLSHISASLFFAKPRFSGRATAAIWLLYIVLMMILTVTNVPTLNFFLALLAHLLLFFSTTKGSVQEKGFLFLSYVNIYTCFSTVFTIINTRLQNELLKIVFAVGIMALMQVILYAVLLPSFRKVMPYIRSGWGKFYAVVLGFFALIVCQAAFPIMSSMSNKEVAVFLLTILSALLVDFIFYFKLEKINMAEALKSVE